MPVPTEIPNSPSPQTDRTITLSLNLTRTGAISLRSCEVIAKSYRNRISFQEQKKIEDVLVGRLVRAIRRCLQKVPEGARVLSIPDFLVELPGLAMSGLHIMMMDATCGVRSAILRVNDFMGAINKAFKTDIGFHDTCPTRSEKLAVNILQDICLPIFNLCRGLDTDAFGADASTRHQLSNRAQEFEFQMELLKRYIYNAGTGHAEPSDNHLYVLARPDPNSIAD